MTNTQKFYSLEEIDRENAQYNVIFGERSNGKTTAVLERILENWIKKGEKGAYIRRYDTDIKGHKGDKVWSSISNERDLVNKWTDGEYTGIVYYNRGWYLYKWDEELQKKVKQPEAFCHALAINTAESYKGTSYPEVTTILFDEFITRNHYLVNEFVEFINLMSTIIRGRNNVKIYMLGNTVNQYNIYFDEMGLYNAREMKQGTIEVYEFRNGEESKDKDIMKVAVEFTGSSEKGKKSDTYFAFDNPKLKMITTGTWELPLYPHAPFRINPLNIQEVFFIEFKGDLLQGDIVIQDDQMFIYFHEKTTPLKDDVKQLYSLEFSPKINHGVSLLKGHRNKLSERIGWMVSKNLVFFQDNRVGEMVRNYIHESERVNAINL